MNTIPFNQFCFLPQWRKYKLNKDLIGSTTNIITFFLQAYDNLSLSDHLLRAVLNLLRREVSEHGRHLQQYFNLFVMYANLGKQITDAFTDDTVINWFLLMIPLGDSRRIPFFSLRQIIITKCHINALQNICASLIWSLGLWSSCHPWKVNTRSLEQ